MDTMIEKPDFVTRNTKFCKIVNMLLTLDMEGNLELDYYGVQTQVSPSIFDNITFKDKKGICTVDIRRYMVGHNPPIYYIRLRGKNIPGEESFWIENPTTFSERLNKLITKYHGLENLDTLEKQIKDICKDNKENK